MGSNCPCAEASRRLARFLTGNLSHGGRGRTLHDGHREVELTGGAIPVRPSLVGKSALLRTHTCGELRLEHVGQEVTLCGWVDTYRDHSGVLFIDLRDRYGKTQVVFAPEGGDETLQASKSLRSEYVVLVRGKVAPRPEGTINPKLATGQIEVRAAHFGDSQPQPDAAVPADGQGVAGRGPAAEASLHRPSPTGNAADLLLRHRMIKIMRDYCDALRTSSTWRRRCSVAARRRAPATIWCRAACSQGTFYALPQSPQLYKQILMVAGYDRYIQVAALFSRRGSASRSAAGVYAVRSRDVVHRRRRYHRRDRRADEAACEGHSGPGCARCRCRASPMTRRWSVLGMMLPDLRFGMEIVDLHRPRRGVEFRVFRGAAERADASAASTPRGRRSLIAQGTSTN